MKKLDHKWRFRNGTRWIHVLRETDKTSRYLPRYIYPALSFCPWHKGPDCVSTVFSVRLELWVWCIRLVYGVRPHPFKEGD
jgi:hypothetical protein